MAGKMVLKLTMITLVTCLLISVGAGLGQYNAVDTQDNSTCWTEAVHLCESSTTDVERLSNDYHTNHQQSSVLHSLLSLEDNCPPWMFQNETSGTCECSDIPFRAVLCDPTIPRTSILPCYCMTFNTERNATELGKCLYGCGHKKDNVYYTLPQSVSALTHYTCHQANRDSTLCGKCKPGYSPLVYSYNMSCMNCTGMTYNWIKYIAAAYIPVTFFFLFVVICRFSGTSPLLRGFITLCQGIVSPVGIRALFNAASRKKFTELILRIFGAWYGIWNLDFFRTVLPPICLDITPLQALVLDYAIAFYPLLLVVVTYALICLHSRDVRIVVWLWRPFHKVFHSIKKDWDLEGSVVKAFATFFLLSYLKILNTTTDLLVYTEKYTLPLGEQSYQTSYALYYDASVEYFRGEHLYYGIAAAFIGLFFVILPLVFLVIYPMRWFQKLLNKLKIQRQAIDMFVNCYQGYYKDGTDGTRDYRCFSITFFLLQITVFVIFTLSRSSYVFPLGAFVMTLFMFTVLAVQPYKEQFKAYSTIDAFMSLLLAGVSIMATAGTEADIKAVGFSTLSYALMSTIALVPNLYLIGLITWWIFFQKKLTYKLPCFRKPELVQLEEFYETDDFPDRIAHPLHYNSQASRLLSVSQESKHKELLYSSVPSSSY